MTVCFCGVEYHGNRAKCPQCQAPNPDKSTPRKKLDLVNAMDASPGQNGESGRDTAPGEESTDSRQHTPAPGEESSAPGEMADNDGLSETELERQLQALALLTAQERVKEAALKRQQRLKEVVRCWKILCGE